MSPANRMPWAVAITAAVIAAVLGAILLARASAHPAPPPGQSRALRAVQRELAALQEKQSALAQAQKTAQSAGLAHLGVCWSSGLDNQTEDVLWVQIDQPVLENGVYQCPQGDQFASVVPGPAPHG